MAIARSSSNPALSDKAFQRLAENGPGWAAGTQQLEDAYNAPSYRPPTVGHDAMTVNGTIWATAALLVLVVASSVARSSWKSRLG